MNQFLTIIVWGILFITSLPQLAMSDDIEVTSEKRAADQKLVIENIKQFKNSNDAKVVVAVKAAHFLREYPYSDIAELIMDMIVYEVVGDDKSKVKARRNRRVLEELLSSLEAIAERRHVFPEVLNANNQSPLIELKMRVIELLKTDEKFKPINEFKKKFDEVITAAKQRVGRRSPKLFLGSNSLTIQYVEQFAVQEAEKLAKEAREKRIAKGEITEDSSSIETEKKLATVTKEEQEKVKGYQSFKDSLLKLAPKGRGGNGTMSEVKAGDSSPVELLLKGTTRFITDEIANDILTDNHLKIRYRDDVLRKLVGVLSRFQQSNAVLLGSTGGGKSSVVELLAEAIILGKVSENVVTRFLADSVIIETSVGSISRLAKSDKPAGQADAMEAYLQALKDVQTKLNRRIIIFFDEIHMLTLEQSEVLKKYTASSKGGILLIGASTSPEYNSSFKHNPAFQRRVEPIAVREFSETEIFQIFRESWEGILNSRHNQIVYPDDVVKLLIRQSTTVYPEKGVLNGSFIFADDLAIDLRMTQNDDSRSITLEKQDVFRFISEQIRLPVDPTDFKGMEDYRQNLIAEISKEVFGQEKMVEDVVRLWMSVLRNQGKRGIRVGMLLGRSGTGKTETAEQLAIKALGSAERVFTIKVSDYADANDIKMGEIFGVPGGVTFGQHTAGRLMDWLDDPSKGKYAGIIVLDEVDKGSLLFWQRFMEFFDTGIVTGGDGKIRRARKHLVIMSTNHGDKAIFPDDVVNWTEQEIKKRISEYGLEELRAIYEEIIPDSIVNRIDMVSLSNLIPNIIAKQIANRLIEKVSEEYLERSNVSVKVDEKVVDYFMRANNTLRRGARPLVRSLDAYLRDSIESALGRIEYLSGDEVVLQIGKNEKGELSLVTRLNGTPLYSSLPRYSGEEGVELSEVRDVSEKPKLKVRGVTQPPMCQLLFGRG